MENFFFVFTSHRDRAVSSVMARGRRVKVAARRRRRYEWGFAAARQVEQQCADAMPAWQAERHCAEQRLPAWQAETPLRGLQPLPAWQAETQGRGV